MIDLYNLYNLMIYIIYIINKKQLKIIENNIFNHFNETFMINKKK